MPSSMTTSLILSIRPSQGLIRNSQSSILPDPEMVILPVSGSKVYFAFGPHDPVITELLSETVAVSSAETSSDPLFRMKTTVSEAARTVKTNKIDFRRKFIAFPSVSNCVIFVPRLSIGGDFRVAGTFHVPYLFLEFFQTLLYILQTPSRHRNRVMGARSKPCFSAGSGDDRVRSGSSRRACSVQQFSPSGTVIFL